jgi:type I restriction enzyme, S subunit
MGWRLARLPETVSAREDFMDGDWIETPFITDSGIRLIQTGNIGVGEYLDKPANAKYITEKTFRLLNCSEVRPGDVLICRLADPVGRSCMVPKDAPPSITSVDCVIYRPDERLADARFMVHLLNATGSLKAAADLSGGSTRQRISRTALGSVLYALPPPGEQRRIAEVLDVLDDQIIGVRSLSNKAQYLKRGLIEELIGGNWSATQLGAVAQHLTSGSRGWAAYYSDDGAKFIRIGNLTRRHINMRFDSVVHVQPPSGSEGSRTKLMTNDVLISITADLGIVGVVSNDLGEAYINQHIALARMRDSSQVMPRWVAHYLSSRIGQDQFVRLNDQGAKAGLNLPTVGALRIPVPPLAYQAKAVEVLDQADSQIAQYDEMLDKLRIFKNGLQSDLLIGKVRLPAEAAS